jgi:hypothetical protein
VFVKFAAVRDQQSSCAQQREALGKVLRLEAKDAAAGFLEGFMKHFR